jgi:hypothetical protein
MKKTESNLYHMKCICELRISNKLVDIVFQFNHIIILVSVLTIFYNIYVNHSILYTNIVYKFNVCKALKKQLKS